MSFGLYVTGTDTGAGKTFCSVALVHALRGRDLAVAGMKPLASGCEQTDEGPRNDDALALQAASEPRPAYADVNPIALREPTAPEIAAAHQGTEVDLSPVRAAYARLAQSHRVVVVEGVGGWLAPLSRELMQRDLVAALGLPAVLVVGLRLGCINHALLTQRALRADGVALLGWIGSAVDPAMDFRAETVAILRRRLAVPCMGVLDHGLDAPAAADRIDLAPLAAQLAG